MSADARQALEDMLRKFVPSARLALEAADRLQAWLDDFQLSARLETPQYANPGELEEDLRLVLAALREQASPGAALIEALQDAGKLPDEWEHSAELESARAHDDSDAKVAVYRMCARELRAALAAARAGETT